jgi:hypothetical protein
VGLRQYDAKCYWIDVEDDEVYLEKPPLPVVDIVESEEDDDLNWAQDIVNQDPIPKSVKLGDGKRFNIPGNSLYSKGWDNFVGWNYWKDVVKIDSKFGEFCYVVYDTTYGEIYVPTTEFSPSEIRFESLNESEEDELEWASNAINNLPSIFNATQTIDGREIKIDEVSKQSWIEAINQWNESHLSNGGTKILQMGGTFSPEYRLKFYLERGGYVLLGNHRVSYMVDDIAELTTEWDDDEGAWGMVKKFLLSLQVRMPLNESEDDLEWAQDAIDNPEYRYGDIVNDLDNDDIISLTGIITDSEGNPMVEVRDSEFRVYKLSSRRDGKYVQLQWSQPSDERPSNWDDIGATVIMSPETFEWDKDLRVKLIHKENHPF